MLNTAMIDERIRVIHVMIVELTLARELEQGAYAQKGLTNAIVNLNRAMTDLQDVAKGPKNHS